MKLPSKKIRVFFITFLVLSLVGCYSIQSLPDHTTITTDQKAYKNRNKFSLSLTSLIDTNSVYEEYCFVSIINNSLPGLNKHKEYTYHYPQGIYKDYYRFYGNGYCNLFSAKANTSELNPGNFDPTKTGHRGVYYKNSNGDIKLDLFTQTGELSSLRSSYGIQTQKITLSGDSLFIQTDNTGNYQIYLKKKATKEIQDVKGW